VPYDVAFSLADDERIAYVIVLGQLAGHRFDWQGMRWKET